MNSLREYFESEAKLFARIPFERMDQLVGMLERARAEGQRVFLFGNGGSASTADHFACDLGKGTIRADKPRLKVLSLNGSMATFSAYANDQGYESVFADQLITNSESGDIAIAFTCSAKSPNVVRAMEVAGKCGLVTVAFTGFEGGKLRDQVDLEVNVPSDSIQQIEDLHLALSHAVCEMLKIQHE